jgi:LCCL domain-containing protein
MPRAGVYAGRTTFIEVHVTRLDMRLVAVALCATAGCVARASLGPTASLPPPPEAAVVADGPIAAGGPPPPEAAVAASEPPPAAPGVIEAGCSFSAMDIQGEPGSVHRIACPADCGATGSTTGTDVYTADSTICRAAIHAGRITGRGGEVTVILEPGRPAYRGSRRHGIESSDYGQYRASYRFAR